MMKKIFVAIKYLMEKNSRSEGTKDDCASTPTETEVISILTK